jgi:hypothetical protein
VGWRRALTGLGAGVLSTTLVLAGTVAPDAESARPNPCRVVTRDEIQAAFGGAVSVGRSVFGTPESEQCEFLVAAAGDRPGGTVIVHLTTRGARAAYRKLQKAEKANAPVDGLPNALYGGRRHDVNLLQGGVLLGVQGNFLVTDPLPLHHYDDKAQLVDLARLGAARV